jgi:cysteine desulfurase family protein (TIGR01976 family)
MLDIDAIRTHFPALQRTFNDRPVVFFDNPAGTQVPTETIDCVSEYFAHSNANTGGYFGTSEETDALIAATREAMADFLSAPAAESIVFGQNMTTLTFAVAHALARLIAPGDEIVTTRLEHDANIAPWLLLQAQGAVIRYIDIDPTDMTLDMSTAEAVIGSRTRLVAAGLASNAFGTVNDVRLLGEMAHAVNAWLFVDAVHYGPHGPIDVVELGADLLACSSYKFFGPHLGILYGRPEVLDVLPAAHVRPAGDASPDKWETGTKNHELLAGLLGTIRYLESLASDGLDRRTRLHTALAEIRAYERTLSERLFSGLLAIPGLTLYGVADPARFDSRVPTASFLVKGCDPDETASALGREGINTWAGDHYAVEPMRRLGIPSTQRIGLTHYNTPEEIDRFLDALSCIVSR